MSVQWHVMGTILGVMCLVFNTDFSFIKMFQVPYGASLYLSLVDHACIL